MNGAIFKIFGGAILIFVFFLVLIFIAAFPSGGTVNQGTLAGWIVFFGFLLFGTVIALGLISLQRWAAMTASGVGALWSLVLASIYSSQPWFEGIAVMPIIFGMFMPLYATITNWDALRELDNERLKSFVHGLQSSDPLHLK